MSDYTATSPEAIRKRRNVPLIIGLIMVLGITILAIWGPAWAPNDPREQKLIIKIADQWYTPPYKAFTPGYLLGSDNLGRDLYSWLLWSIRPTMFLILIVASIRMIIGVVLGVIAGYSDRWPGKLADALIAAALSIPALIASIMIITAVGFHLGIWAFVLGLVATGWAETASLVRERTRTIRAQQAVEASVALGASSGQTFFLHIMPQVMPMVWMLLAFEVSNTLVTMAGLGFLGYYLGGAVFQEVDDFVYQRISEMPELGQMLATAWLVLDEPWAMVAAGTVIFIIVLAFNLIGEGLQNRLTRKLGGSRSFYLTMAGSILPWWDDSIREPLGKLVRIRVFQVGAMFVVVIVLAVSVFVNSRGIDQSTITETATPQPNATLVADNKAGEDVDLLSNALQIPGGHYWTNEFSDPWHSRVVDYTGPTTDTVQWTFETPLGFVGGPAVDKDGVLYIAARDQDEAGQDSGLLYALSTDGVELWQLVMSSKPVGTPALAHDGSLLVCDKAGVTAFTAEGAAKWRYEFDLGKAPTSGPIIAPDGSIYIKAWDGMWALTAEGVLRWHTPLSDTAATLTPHLSPDGDWLFWQDLALDTTSGDIVELVEGDEAQAALSQYVTGADGKLYYRLAEALYEYTPSSDSDGVIFDGSTHTWDSADAGVIPNGQTWLLARPTSGGQGLGFYWSQPGSADDVIGKLSIPQARNIKVLAVDSDQMAFVCMDSHNGNSSCVAIAPEGVKAQLRFNFRGVQAIAGSALAPGRLYVATRDGMLMAMGEDADVLAQAEITPDPKDTVRDLSTWDVPVYPGGHPWSHEKGDPWGTRWAAFNGPQDAELLWVMENGSGYTAAPVVAADGTVYANAADGRLMAYAPDGSFKWAARLKASGVGSPAIGPNGTIYITDEAGFLLAFDTEGNQLWMYHVSGDIAEPIYSRTSGEVLREEVYILDGAGPAGGGPMVVPDGTIYYTLAVKIRPYVGGVVIQNEVLLGVTSEGTGLYEEPPFTWSGRQIPRLSANDAWLILHDHFLMPRLEIAPDGVLLNEVWRLGEEFYADEEHEGWDLNMRVGANGGLYRSYRRTLERFTQTDLDVQIESVYQMDEEISPGTLVDIGVTQDGYQWMFFRNGSIAWITPDCELLEIARFPLESMLFALDQGNVAYGCGSSMGRAPECMAFAPGVEDPLWLITLQESEKVAGGALAPGVLYVTTEQGRLYALGTP